jgi:hypothetical protein
LSDNPFWFLNEKLLVALLTDEFRLITELFVKYPKLREFFDLPDATAEQKVACYALLVHRTLIAEIDEKFLGLYQQPPSLGEEGRDITALTQNLFADDAPLWVSEINSVAERLPTRIYNALPEPLRRGGFNASDPTQMEIIRSAANKLSNLKEIQKLNKEVFDQQLQRLEKRWSAAIVQIRESQIRELKKRKGRRPRDKKRISRDKMIEEIDAVCPTVNEFLKVMDERKVPHQPTWSEWPGSWVQAYKKPHLRELIQKDKSRALSRARTRRNS